MFPHCILWNSSTRVVLRLSTSSLCRISCPFWFVHHLVLYFSLVSLDLLPTGFVSFSPAFDLFGLKLLIIKACFLFLYPPAPVSHIWVPFLIIYNSIPEFNHCISDHPVSCCSFLCKYDHWTAQAPPQASAYGSYRSCYHIATLEENMKIT